MHVIPPADLSGLKTAQGLLFRCKERFLVGLVVQPCSVDISISPAFDRARTQLACVGKMPSMRKSTK